MKPTRKNIEVSDITEVNCSFNNCTKYKNEQKLLLVTRCIACQSFKQRIYLDLFALRVHTEDNFQLLAH